jgi:hypothetical protein
LASFWRKELNNSIGTLLKKGKIQPAAILFKLWACDVLFFQGQWRERELLCESRFCSMFITQSWKTTKLWCYFYFHQIATYQAHFLRPFFHTLTTYAAFIQNLRIRRIDFDKTTHFETNIFQLYLRCYSYNHQHHSRKQLN